eukprot:375270-Pelagomonas_calceolata.AAC.8
MHVAAPPSACMPQGPMGESILAIHQAAPPSARVPQEPGKNSVGSQSISACMLQQLPALTGKPQELVRTQTESRVGAQRNAHVREMPITCAISIL